MLIEIPIVGGVVAADQVTAIRHHAGGDLGGGMLTMPRVFIDTRQMVGAFTIECDDHATMMSVVKTLTEACMTARREAVAAMNQ